ncbi:sensor histidine kinase [Spirillospora sp. NPDC048911]|uniref:sensor histidine kinase n=1 Tax=Spirillospora sp. NPDC048911 TaxID=3364527 RepID=UPI00371C3C0B
MSVSTTWVRLGVAFRLLVSLRLLTLAMAMALMPAGRLDADLALTAAGLAVASTAAIFAWRPVLSWLVRWPILACVDALLAAAVLVQGGVFGACFLVTVSTSAIAGVLYSWRPVLVVCVTQIALSYMAIVLGEPLTGRPGTAILVSGFYPVAACAGVCLRRLLDQYADAETALRNARTAAAAAEERNRLAREMHDSLAKTLHGIAMSATALPTWIRRSPDRAEHTARDIVDALQVATREARGLIADLRDETFTLPLDVAVRRITAEWGARHRVQIRLDVVPGAPGDRDVPLMVRYEVISIMKEALTNVARHAGARRVDVRLACLPEGVELAVRDDGGGFAVPVGEGLGHFSRAGHYGLVGMEERARQVGGRLTVHSRPGDGTTIVITVPSAPPPVAETPPAERRAS